MNVTQEARKVAFAIASLLWALGFACAADEQRISELIEKLTSDSYQEREDATKGLWEMGIEAKQALEDAALSDDPEKAIRAAKVLRKVELRITPGTPQRVIDLIEKYQGASIETKASILDQLKDMKAYHQMLTLYAMDRPEARVNLAQQVRGVAIMAAREALVNDDEEGAIAILTSTINDRESARALACLHFHAGRRGEEFMAMRPEQISVEVWSMLLMRAEENIQALMEFANRQGKEKTLITLQVLSGNPIPWLEQNDIGNQRHKAPDTYVGIAIKRWKGEIIPESEYADLIKIVRANDGPEKEMAMSSLALLGRLPEVEEEQAKESPIYGFSYYLSLEDVPKALACLGLDPEKPDYNGWIKKRFESLNDLDDVDGRNAHYELISIASFLEKRGLHKELKESFSEQLSVLAKEREGEFLKIIRSMMSSVYGASAFGVEQATIWAGDDEQRWEDIYTVALGEDDAYSDWRAWIKTIDPKVSQREILEILLSITLRSQSHGELREIWIDKLWKAVELEKDEKKKSELIIRMLSLSANQHDVANALRAWDMLEDKEKASELLPSIDKYFSAAGRWEDALKHLDASGAYVNTPSPELSAYYAVHLRRAGLEEKANEYDQLVNILSLGDVSECVRIAEAYLYGGDQVRAADWFKRAVYNADFEHPEFISVLKPYTDAMVRKGDWLVAASCYEVLLQIYASQPLDVGSLSSFAKERLGADLMKAMAILDVRRDHALRLLQGIHRNFVTDGVLADDFFPLLRKRGLNKELEQYFAESWKRLEDVAKKYPESHNTKNTAGWLASRAGIKLKEAEKMLNEALDVAPEQSAYLDTLAEIKFAQGDRKAAIRSSDRAMNFSPFDDMIRMQNERFRYAELPKK